MGVSSENGNDETMMAIKGGATFDERLNQLALAQQSLSDAYNDLGLGKSAQLALDEAQKLKLDAEQKYETATKASEDMVTKARENAETMSKRVRLMADQERKAIADERAALTSWYDTMVSELTVKRADADAVTKEAIAHRRAAVEIYDEADELKLGLVSSKIAYDAELAALRDLHMKVARMMAELRYVDVSPDKVPPVVIPEPEPDLGGSMGGVLNAAPEAA